MNIYDLPNELSGEETLEVLWTGASVHIERIVSNGQVSPPGFWYDQPGDEWCILLQGQAVIAWEKGRKQEMNAGDYLFIPAHARHRVEYTSSDPPCIWLAVHSALVEEAR